MPAQQDACRTSKDLLRSGAQNEASYDELRQLAETALDCLGKEGSTAEEREPAHYLLTLSVASLGVKQREAYEALAVRYNPLAAEYTKLIASARQYAQSAPQADSYGVWTSIAQSMAASLSKYEPPKQLHCTTQHVGTTSFTNCREY